MNKISALFSNRKLFPVWFVLAAAAFIYGLYAFYYTFLDWNDIPIVMLNALLAGAGFTGVISLAAAAKKERGGAKRAAVYFGGLAVFEAVLWAILTIVNVDGQYNRRAVYVAYAVVTVLFTSGAVVLFARLSKQFCKPLNIIFAVACFPLLFAIAVQPAKNQAKNVLVTIQSTSDISFEPISAEEVKINETDRKNCVSWFDGNILGVEKGLEPAFDFTVGRTTLREIIREGKAEIKITDAKENRKNGKTSVISITPADYGIEVTVEATVYESAASCEWTVFIKNTGAENTEVIKNFRAADFTSDRGEGDVYYSLGSHSEADDFLLKKIKNGKMPVLFGSSEGRSSDLYLPYFNYSGKNGGFVLGIGWTGLWTLKTSSDGAGANVSVSQKKLEGYLTPGEEIRSPLVSMSFYDSENPVKGFNTFRRYITDCVYPEGVNACTMLETAGPESVRTADEILADLDTLEPEIFEQADYFWMDAGWYEFKENWSDGVGNWTYDESRYDNGIRELADYGAEKGLGQVLWYEPERVLKDTVFYNKGMENEGWLLDTGKDTRCWNLANGDALAWYTEYLAASMKENGVTYYRQDQNMPLDGYWTAGDKAFFGGRQGFCENHYVCGEYKYLDALTEKIPGLLIDNCASGGRRLDLEMTRRSIPIWRSDYNCASHPDLYEATQSQTLGLSCWLPLSGTIKYSGDRYMSLTSLIPCLIETLGTVHSEFYGTYGELRNNMCGNYYPVVCGGLKNDGFLSSEYASVEGDRGFIVSYRRPECGENVLTAKFSGLVPDAEYLLYDYYAPDITFTMTGREMMEEGLKLTFNGCPDAILILFEKQ